MSTGRRKAPSPPPGFDWTGLTPKQILTPLPDDTDEIREWRTAYKRHIEGDPVDRLRFQVESLEAELGRRRTRLATDLEDVELEMEIRQHRRRQQARLIVQQESHGDEWPETDLEGVFDNGIELPVPGVLARTDGRCLLYRGLPNVVFGDASAGKTSLAIATAAQVIRQGLHVFVVDYETNVAVWLSRLVALGLTRKQITTCLHYLDVRSGARPPKKVRPDAALTVIDSMTSALDALGAEPNDTTGIEAVYRQMIDPFTDAGAAVLLIDHVGHADKSRPMNSIRKTGRVQGAMFRMSAVPGRPFGRGRTGEAVLEVHKDNMGGLELPKGAMAGRFVMASTDGGARIICAVEPDGKLDLAGLSAVAASQPDPAAKKRDDVLRALQLNGELSRTDLRKEAKGKTDVVNTAIDELVAAGTLKQIRRGNANFFALADS